MRCGCFHRRVQIRATSWFGNLISSETMPMEQIGTMTYEEICGALQRIQNEWLKRLRHAAQAAAPPSEYLSGKTHLFAVSPPRMGSGPSRVIVCVGVNYTQEGRIPDEGFPAYDHGAGPQFGGMVTNLGHSLSHYQTHGPEWRRRQHASKGLEVSCGDALASTVVVANFCPFITTKEWLKCRASFRRELLVWSAKELKPGPFGFLDDLHASLAADDPLWVAHGLHSEVAYLFRWFSRRHRLSRWLLTPNLSRPYNYSKRHFVVGNRYLSNPLGLSVAAWVDRLGLRLDGGAPSAAAA